MSTESSAESRPSTASAQHSASAASSPSSPVSSSSSSRANAAFVVTVVIAIYAIAAGLVYAGLGIFSKSEGGWSRVGHIALGILFIIAGIVALVNLQQTTAWLAIFIAILVGIMWIVEGIVALSTLGDARRRCWSIFFAIISIIAGLYLLFNASIGARCCGGCWASRSSSSASSTSCVPSPTGRVRLH